MVSWQEVVLRATIGAAYDGRCEIRHRVPFLATSNLELLLNVDVAHLWN